MLVPEGRECVGNHFDELEGGPAVVIFVPERFDEPVERPAIVLLIVAVRCHSDSVSK